MILVNAANGHLGRAITSALLKKTDVSHLVLAARNSAKLEASEASGISYREADYDSPDSMLAACEGISTVILIPSPAPKEQRIQQNRNVIEAAKLAGVSHLVMVSFMDARENSPLTYAATFYDAEKMLATSGLNWTIMRMPVYIDSIINWLPDSLANGVIFASSGDGKMPYLTRADLAESIAVVATEKGHEGKTYELTGTKALSYADVAKLASEVYGKSVVYEDLTPEAHYERIKNSGAPEYMLRGAIGMSASTKEGTFNHVTNHVEQLTGHKPESLRSFLKRHPLFRVSSMQQKKY